MNITAGSQALEQIKATALVVGCFSDQLKTNAILNSVADLSQPLGSSISRLINETEFDGSLNATYQIPAPEGIGIARVLLVGLGESGKWCGKHALQAAGTAVRLLASKQRSTVVFSFPSEHLSEAVCGAMVGCQGQDLYKNKKVTYPFEEVIFLTTDAQAVDHGRIFGESVNLTRRLVNQPANVTYPQSFAAECQSVAEQHRLEIEIWDEKKLAAEKCGSLLAVARGSVRPPRLVIMRYRGGSATQKPLALVGKGVTFDSGGLSLKPTDGMKNMKCDMAGAATVLGAINAIAQLKLPVNVIGLMGLVENLISGDAYKLGDVLTARNGKTIEVLNTDAEGRLVLADVLDVANSEQAGQIVDLATLTGACVVALGMEIAGVMTNNQDWCDQLLSACAASGERVWQLPMDAEFADKIKSDVADIKNVGNGRWGGAITAAKFLEEFVGETPWVHMDIAGPSFAEKPAGYIDGGASGCYVRSLAELARRISAP